jgi:hypothetical protein
MDKRQGDLRDPQLRQPTLSSDMSADLSACQELIGAVVAAYRLPY